MGDVIDDFYKSDVCLKARAKRSVDKWLLPSNYQ